MSAKLNRCGNCGGAEWKVSLDVKLRECTNCERRELMHYADWVVMYSGDKAEAAKDLFPCDVTVEHRKECRKNAEVKTCAECIRANTKQGEGE